MAWLRSAVYLEMYLALVPYRLTSICELNGVVEPKSEQMVEVPAGAAPLNVETGTSTAGVRTPPITLPFWSSSSAAGFWLERRKGSGDGGGVPRTTQRSKLAKADCATTCCGPLLMALEQCRTLE